MNNLDNFFKLPIWKTFIVCCSVSFSFLCNLNAQTTNVAPLFTLVNPNTLALTAAETAASQAFINDSTTKSFYWVNYPDIANLQYHGYLAYSLPDSTVIFSEAISTEFSDSINYVWAGKNLVNGNYGGNSIFIKNAGGVIGQINIGNKFYCLVPVTNTCGLLLEVYKNEFNCGTLSSNTGGGPGGPDLDCQESPNCSVVIDILFLVTPEAKTFLQAKYSTPLYLALFYAMNIASINVSFINSDILGKKANLTVVDYSGFTYNYEANLPSINSDRLALPNTASAIALRELYKADMVFLLTNQGYGEGGAVSEIGDIKNLAFGILEAKFMGSSYATAHEIGHILGARHETNLDPKGVCNHAHVIFTDEPKWTLMFATFGAPWDYRLKLLNFSNPDVSYFGVPTGDEIDNNAKKLKATTCRVAKFFDPEKMNVKISGVNNSCGIFSYTAVIDQVPASSSYTYEWRWNFSGVFNSADPGFYTGNSSSILLGDQNCPFYFLKVKVTSASGEVATDIIKITKQGCPSCFTSGKQSKKLNAVDNLNITLFPNPVMDLVKLNIFTDVDQNIDVLIWTVDGKIVKQVRNAEIYSGSNIIELAVADLCSGTYVCGVRAGQTLERIKFSILK